MVFLMIFRLSDQTAEVLRLLALEDKGNRFSDYLYLLLCAPLHLVTGSAGCREGRDHFRHNPFEWSAFRSQDYGYTKFKAFNKTHINIEQVSVDLDGEVIDTFWLVKNKTLSFKQL